MKPKARIATCSLSGCFGCHMSLLDIDERIATLADIAVFDRSPLTDIKQLGRCDIGLVEGGLCNAENVEVLLRFRENCRILVAVGACAATGGIPAMRNHHALGDCLHEAYGDTVPDDPELPLLLDRVRPVQEAVDIDFVLPGCPPSADAIWTTLTALLEGRRPSLPYDQLHYE